MKVPPPPPRKAPTNLKPVIEQWQEAKEKIKQWQEEEMNLRKYLAAQLCPKPKEGVNHIVKPGLEATLKHTINRRVDEAAYNQMRGELRKKGINIDALVELKPSLVLKAYRELDKRRRAIFDVVLKISDGTPQLEVNLE